jgi:hypothetical protein
MLKTFSSILYEVLRIVGAITHYGIKGTDYKVLNLIPRILMRSVKIHRGL